MVLQFLYSLRIIEIISTNSRNSRASLFTRVQQFKNESKSIEIHLLKSFLPQREMCEMCEPRGWRVFHKKDEKKTNREIEWNFPQDCIFLLISLFFDNHENRSAHSCRPHVSPFRLFPCKSYLLLLSFEILHEILHYQFDHIYSWKSPFYVQKKWK